MLHLTRSQLDQIFADARQAAPEECCGILVGRREHDDVIVTGVEPSRNTWDGDRRTRFMLDALTHLRVQREARAAGLDIVGFYHSHPDSPATPSRFDREMAWPEYSYLIVSLAADPPEVQPWRLEGENAEFSAESIVIRDETS